MKSNSVNEKYSLNLHQISFNTNISRQYLNRGQVHFPSAVNSYTQQCLMEMHFSLAAVNVYLSFCQLRSFSLHKRVSLILKFHTQFFFFFFCLQKGPVVFFFLPIHRTFTVVQSKTNLKVIYRNVLQFFNKKNCNANFQ